MLAQSRTSRMLLSSEAALRGFTDSLRCELAHDRSRVHITMVQLSAFNTPQFDWGRTTMSRQPRPMGKIFEPEVAARAIYWAATHRRRELWVGWPAVQAILGTRILPGLLDRLLGATAVEGQQTDQPLPPNRCDNLWAPVPGDHGVQAVSTRRRSPGARNCGSRPIAGWRSWWRSPCCCFRPWPRRGRDRRETAGAVTRRRTRRAAIRWCRPPR
jgi:hypothetical protein